MPAQILVAVPVLNRPRRARPFYESLCAATPAELVRLVFLTSPGDHKERRAVVALDGEIPADSELVGWRPEGGDWARKLNYAIAHSSEPFILCAADDLAFGPGWAEAALACAEASGAGVVGTNDLHNTRRETHSTHPLVRRSYAERGAIDGGPCLHEGYDHQFVDDELVGTAKSRGAWTFCREAVVEHLHPYFGLAPADDTYRKGWRQTAADNVLHRQRRRLWS